MSMVLERLAELASGVSFDQLSPEVVREAKRRLLDALGCMVGAAAEETVEATRAVALALGGPEEATVVGAGGRRTAVDRATLVNSTALRYLDYMDSHPGPTTGHACLNIPAVLAVGESVGASGAQVIRGIVLGYEVQIRLVMGAGDPSITAHGWSGSTNLGISVPAAIGGLLRLSAEQLAHAMAISATHAPVLEASSRGQIPESKACVDGMVAMTAVVSTLLAKEGIAGPLGAFEGAGGYVEAMAHKYQEDIVLAPMDRFRVIDVHTKRYNTVKCARPAVAAGLALVSELPAGWRDIERLTLRLPERDCRQQRKDEADRRRPQTRHTANHSAVYSLAAAIVDGDLRPEQFELGRLRDPDILGLIDRISLEADPELEGYFPAAIPARVEIVTRYGQVRTETVVYPPGHAKNPLTDEQLAEKFRGLASRGLTPEAMDTIVQQIRRLEELESIRPLMELIGAAYRR